MPVNNEIPIVPVPFKKKTEEAPTTKILAHLASIDVTLLSAPSLEDLYSYIPDWVTATWRDTAEKYLSQEERKQLFDDTLDGLMLPTALETINLVFRIDNLDLIDVTHLIRHRTLSFSAQCTADRDLRHDPALVKETILFHEKFLDRFTDIVKQAKELYSVMVDSGEISILDARTILPRCLPAFYYVRGNLKDILSFIRTRLDEQIQPMSDNVIAMRMFVELCRKYPMLTRYATIGGRDDFYCKTALSGRNSNIYPPKEENDTFYYNEESFQYSKRREEFVGAEAYEVIKSHCLLQLEIIEDEYNKREVE